MKNKSEIILLIISYAFAIVMSRNMNKFYMVTEHPKITYVDHKYASFVNLTSKRYGRCDPTYYVGLHANFIYPLGNNITVSFYFYELLTNVYKRSFVEMHFKICDLIKKDKFFGSALNQGKFRENECPFPPGQYHLYNMTVPVEIIPPNFPFTRGRIYANLTATDTSDLLGSGHINMELRPYKKNKN